MAAPPQNQDAASLPSEPMPQLPPEVQLLKANLDCIELPETLFPPVMKHEAFAGMLHEAATNKLALLTCNRDSLFGNARLANFTRKAYNSLMYQLPTFCIRLGDYSTLLTLHLNAPLVSFFFSHVVSVLPYHFMLNLDFFSL